MNRFEDRSNFGKLGLVSLVLAVSVASIFALLYFQSTERADALRSELGSVQNQLRPNGVHGASLANATILDNQISAYQSQVATLSKQIASDQSEISTLEGNVSASGQAMASYNNQLTSLQGQARSLENQTASLQDTINSDNGRISSLENQLAQLQSTINSDTGQIASLQSQVSADASNITNDKSQISTLVSRLNLGVSQTEYQSTLQGLDGQYSEVIQFTAQYAGYVSISGTSSNSGAQVQVDDSNSHYSWNGNNLGFGQLGTVYFPVLPGTITVSVYASCGVLGCVFEGGSYSATMTVTYVS